MPQTKHLSPAQIQKITSKLINSWIAKHGNSEDSARHFWLHLTRELYRIGGKKAVQAGIDALKKKGSMDNAKVMEEELEKLQF